MQNNSYKFQPDEEPDFILQKYIGILRRRMWWLITISLISFSLLMIHLIKSIPIYRAESLVRIAENTYESDILDEITQSGKVTKDIFKTQCEILKSKTILNMVAEKLSKDSLPDIKDSVFNIKKIQTNLNITPISNTFLVKITYDSPEPKLAAIVANLVPKCYMEWQEKEQTVISESALQWLHNELEDLKDNADEKYTEIEEYTKANDVTISVEALMIQREQTAQEYMQAKLKCLQLNRNCSQIRALLKDNDTISSLPPSLLNQRITELLNLKRNKEIELSNAHNVYKTKHPKIIELESEVITINENLLSALKEREKEFDIGYTFSQEKESELFEHLKKIEKRISEKNLENLKVKKMEKDLESSTELYDVLLKKSKKAEVGTTNLLSHFSIIDYASPPEKPFKPNIPAKTPIYLIISLILGLAVIFVIDYFDTTITAREDVTEKLDLKCIGVIPYTKEKDDHNFIPFEKCDLILNEAFKGVDTSIHLLSLDDKRIKRIIFTSTHAKEGKTFIITNLALKIAQSDKKVVVIDTDFYSLGLSKNFDTNSKPGLSNVLKGEIEVMDSVTASSYNNLFILSGGTSVLKSSVLSYETQINEIFNKLEKEFDLLIVDAPPSNITADIFAIAKETDGVIFVINSQKTYLQEIKKRISQLKEQRINILGVILNSARKFSLKDSYYSYYYKRDKA